jgi:hypothetical protein
LIANSSTRSANLDLHFAFSGFRILPAVARVTSGYSLALNASEVADVLEVPLAFLMTPTNLQFVKGDWGRDHQ